MRLNKKNGAKILVVITICNNIRQLFKSEVNMSSKTYSISPAKIGNSTGFRLPASFYRDNPQFANATGWVEVVAQDTLLIKLEPSSPESEDEDNELMLSLFLDFITKDALKHSDRLEAYTEAMAKDDDELLAGVELDQ